MDRRSWLWRRKSQEKSSDTQSQCKINTIDQEGLRVGSNCDTPKTAKSFDDSSIFGDENELHETIKDLNEKLNDAISTIHVKEELVKNHARVAEEAVSGWEKSQTEVETLKIELEMSLQKNFSLQDQIENLQIALKECFIRFQESRKMQEEIFDENNKNIENLEKEKKNLKAKLSGLVDENNLLARNAEVARKRYLESVKKANKFENECIKLQTICENNKKGMNKISIWSSEIELMDDFLEMERLVSLLETEKSKKDFEMRVKIEKFERQKAELELQIEKLHEKEKLLVEKFEREKRLMEDMKSKLEMANLEIAKLKNELDISNEKIKEEKAVSVEFETKYRELEAWIANINGEAKLKQEKEVANSARKLSECQNTIASLNKQLKCLANFDEFMEENEIPDFIQDSQDADYNGGDKIIHVVNTA